MANDVINGFCELKTTVCYKLTLTEAAASALMQIVQNSHPEDSEEHRLTKEMVFTLLQNAGCSV